MTGVLAEPELTRRYPGIVVPAYLTVPEVRDTLGGEVADLCDQVGFAPDPEQRMLLDLIFARATDPDTRADQLAAFEVAVICCRQNMKTGLFKQAALGWLFVTDERLVMWSAHEFNTALEAFGDLDEIITGSDMLRRRIKIVHRSHGEEGFELYRNAYGRGGRLKFKARTKSGGRGLTGDKVVLDEAFALIPTHMGALIPTLSARPEPQVLYGSSAGLSYSDVLRGMRDRGRAGSPRLVYAEWCDPTPDDQFVCRLPKCNHTPGQPGCLLDDEERWNMANPAIGRRITLTYIRGERRTMPPDEFVRERLGRWDDPVKSLPIHPATWVQLADPAAALPPGAPVVFGIDASPGLRSAAIVVTGKCADGRQLLDVASHGPGIDWVIERVKQLEDRHSPAGWALDPNGPAGSLLADLTNAGITVTEMTSRDMGQACTNLANQVRTGTALVHKEVPTDEDPSAGPLTRAVRGAGQRDIGDGMWGWRRTTSDADICPIVAATAATWLYTELAPDGDDEPGIFFI